MGLIVSLGPAPVSVVQPAFAGGVATGLLVAALPSGEPITPGERLALGAMPLALLLLALSSGEASGEPGRTADHTLLLAVSLGSLPAAIAVALLAGARRASATRWAGRWGSHCSRPPQLSSSRKLTSASWLTRGTKIGITGQVAT
ncbi:hypothetical protein [Marinactinospora rubrisoli]|uniref:Uncharacterized protein n=1 Tax=Marinactinospora rubrisoli TaxID=2715399 RepID=A0ABW2KI79_9ACTN